MDLLSTDIIKEVMNVGIGEAAFALSELVNAPVMIQVPDLRITEVANIPRYIDQEGQDLGVFISQDFHGIVEGKVLLSYSRACSISLVNLLFGDNKDAESLSNIDIATLQEIGNIIMVSCLSTISDMIEGRMTFTMPLVTAGLSDRYFMNLVQELEKFEQCILIKNEMVIKGHNIQGYIFVLLSFKDLQIIVEKLSKKMG